MAQAVYEIRVLTYDNGASPFEDWYRGIQDSATRSRIGSRLMRIQAGNFGDCKSVGAGVSELRMDFGPGYRVYFARVGKMLIVLIGGGEKSTQNRDIADARSLWEQYKNVPERFERSPG